MKSRFMTCSDIPRSLLSVTHVWTVKITLLALHLHSMHCVLKLKVHIAMAYFDHMEETVY